MHYCCGCWGVTIKYSRYRGVNINWYFYFIIILYFELRWSFLHIPSIFLPAYIFLFRWWLSRSSWQSSWDELIWSSWRWPQHCAVIYPGWLSDVIGCPLWNMNMFWWQYCQHRLENKIIKTKYENYWLNRVWIPKIDKDWKKIDNKVLNGHFLDGKGVIEEKGRIFLES